MPGDDAAECCQVNLTRMNMPNVAYLSEWPTPAPGLLHGTLLIFRPEVR